MLSARISFSEKRVPDVVKQNKAESHNAQNNYPVTKRMREF